MQDLKRSPVPPIESCSLSAVLKQLRMKKGVTLRQVQNDTGVSNAYLSQLETGKASEPSPRVLRKLATYYGASYGHLMQVAGYLPLECPAQTPKPQRRLYPALAAFYAHLVPLLAALARQHGYALAVHGSMATDLDLLAVPWTEEADEAEVLVEALRELVGGIIPNDPDAYSGDLLLHNPNTKPHGRRAWSIYWQILDGYGVGPYIDLSVMPRQAQVLEDIA